MTEQERKKYMEQIQDVLLDLQLEGKIKIEEITTKSENGCDITTIQIQPVLNSQEEVEEFYRRAKACGYITMDDKQQNTDNENQAQ